MAYKWLINHISSLLLRGERPSFNLVLRPPQILVFLKHGQKGAVQQADLMWCLALVRRSTYLWTDVRTTKEKAMHRSTL